METSKEDGAALIRFLLFQIFHLLQTNRPRKYTVPLGYTRIVPISIPRPLRNP